MMKMRHLHWYAVVAVVAAMASLPVLAVAQDGVRNRDASDSAEQKSIQAEPKIVPPHGHGDADWRLGITIAPSDIGVRVREVLQGSPAARVGLEPRDIIVNVNGYQVGEVAGRDYPLDEELQRRAGHNGRVSLLVQDHRSNRLVTVPVQLERAHGGTKDVIRGVVEYRERMALPPDAVLRVTLQRGTFRGMETIAEETYRNPGNPPIRFELHYPRESVFPREKYYLTAQIDSGGRRILVSEDPYVLRFGDKQEDIRIMLRRD